MNALLWLLIVALIIAAIGAVFALVRSRQRAGDVFASRPTNQSDGA